MKREHPRQRLLILSNLLPIFFYKDGYGDPLLSVIYLKSVGISSIPITKFIGNKFNCLFYNAAGNFYLANHLKAYLKNSKSTLNYTQDFIYTWIRNDVILASCRAVGIICRLLSEPYWKFAADDSKCAIDMGNIYNRLSHF